MPILSLLLSLFFTVSTVDGSEFEQPNRETPKAFKEKPSPSANENPDYIIIEMNQP
ncbi:MAG: hypothetical protein IPH12_11505 [Saprospirales bacterium]|nr:hypothetical protein [Saprospirales bacterium]MBK8919949.1 hypothetical protein [Saprospirales bacterium]